MNPPFVCYQLSNPDFIFKLLLFEWFCSSRRFWFLQCLWSFLCYAELLLNASGWVFLFCSSTFFNQHTIFFLNTEGKYLVINFKPFTILNPGFIIQECMHYILHEHLTSQQHLKYIPRSLNWSIFSTTVTTFLVEKNRPWIVAYFLFNLPLILFLLPRKISQLYANPFAVIFLYLLPELYFRHY